VFATINVPGSTSHKIVTSQPERDQFSNHEKMLEHSCVIRKARSVDHCLVHGSPSFSTTCPHASLDHETRIAPRLMMV
jgi:hypothetical protein